MKTCTKCGVSKPLSAYHKDRSKKDGLHPKCKDCHKAWSDEYRTRPGIAERNAQRNKAWREANPERSIRGVKCATLRKKYGITLDEYETLLAKQDGKCAICGTTESSWGSMAVDHDHTNGEIRGLLCFDCNTVLGKMKDDPALLRRAAEYLESSSKS